jgi:hypothetical protein
LVISVIVCHHGTPPFHRGVFSSWYEPPFDSSSTCEAKSFLSKAHSGEIGAAAKFLPLAVRGSNQRGAMILIKGMRF